MSTYVKRSYSLPAKIDNFIEQLVLTGEFNSRSACIAHFIGKQVKLSESKLKAKRNQNETQPKTS